MDAYTRLEAATTSASRRIWVDEEGMPTEKHQGDRLIKRMDKGYYIHKKYVRNVPIPIALKYQTSPYILFRLLKKDAAKDICPHVLLYEIYNLNQKSHFKVLYQCLIKEKHGDFFECTCGEHYQPRKGVNAYTKAPLIYKLITIIAEHPQLKKYETMLLTKIRFISSEDLFTLFYICLEYDITLLKYGSMYYEYSVNRYTYTKTLNDTICGLIKRDPPIVKSILVNMQAYIDEEDMYTFLKTAIEYEPLLIYYFTKYRNGYKISDMYLYWLSKLSAACIQEELCDMTWYLG